MRKSPLLASALMVLVGTIGCQQPSSTGDLDNLVDADNDGFVDIAPPDGVTANEATNAKVVLSNSIGTEDIGPLAQQQGIDPSLLNLVAIEVDIVMTLNYDGFESLVLRQTQDLEPFDRAMEAACPDSVVVDVTVVAKVPFIGDQEVFSGTFEQVQGVQYECGETITVETLIDDSGLPAVNVTTS